MTLEVFGDNVDVNDGSYVTITPTVGEIWAIRGLGLANTTYLQVRLDGYLIYDEAWGDAYANAQEVFGHLRHAVLFAASTAVLRFDNTSGSTNYVAHYSGVKIPSALGAVCATTGYTTSGTVDFAPGAGYIRVITLVSANNASLDDVGSFLLTDGTNYATLLARYSALYQYGYAAKVSLLTTPNYYLRADHGTGTTNGCVSAIDLPDTLFGGKVKTGLATVSGTTVEVMPDAGKAWMCGGFTVAGNVTNGTYAVAETGFPWDASGIAVVLTTACYLKFAGADASKHLYSAIELD